MPAQQPYGNQENPPSMGQNLQFGGPGGSAQQPLPGGQHSPLVQPGAQYGSSNGPSYQMGYAGSPYPVDSQNTQQLYDPQNPQLSGEQDTHTWTSSGHAGIDVVLGALNLCTDFQGTYACCLSYPQNCFESASMVGKQGLAKGW